MVRYALGQLYFLLLAFSPPGPIKMRHVGIARRPVHVQQATSSERMH